MKFKINNCLKLIVDKVECKFTPANKKENCYLFDENMHFTNRLYSSAFYFLRSKLKTTDILLDDRQNVMNYIISNL